MTMHYRLYGLHLESDFAVDGLLPTEAGTLPADITFRQGSAPSSLSGVVESGTLYQVTPREFLLTVPNVARYYVQDGRQITVDAAPDADDESVRLFLLGSALGALLHQRGMLPLHASAVEMPGGAALFTGASGVGKSTTAAALTRKGYRLIADDIAVVYAGRDGIPMAAPAFPQMKLWAQSLHKLQTDTEGLHRVRPALEKYALAAEDTFRDEPLPVRVVYLLVSHNQDAMELKPVDGMMRVRALRNQVYRRRIMEQMGADSAHFAALTALASRAALRTIRRPQHQFLLDELVALLEADFAAVGV
ncbi:MAG: hypothetical protein JNL42_08570 [Anaerolineae bacterium]|nr:hypothetical protein [Anaerolineae bacterium]